MQNKIEYTNCKLLQRYFRCLDLKVKTLVLLTPTVVFIFRQRRRKTFVLPNKFADRNVFCFPKFCFPPLIHSSLVASPLTPFNAYSRSLSLYRDYSRIIVTGRNTLSNGIRPGNSESRNWYRL